MPISNVVLEHMFSKMNHVHTDWRNCLGEKRVENLLRICKEGPDPDEFDSRPALARWTAKCATQQRPNVKPSGSRASRASGSKRKLPHSEVTENVKKLLSNPQDSDSSDTQLDSEPETNTNSLRTERVR